MNEMLIGAIAACSFLVGLFFVRFWQTTRDKFFLWFAASFFLESANRVSLCLFFDLREVAPSYYLIKVLAYSFIIFAILQKNSRQKTANGSKDSSR